MQNRKVSTQAGVPVLRDIPLLGWFFNQTREESVQSELVILIQPRIVETALDENQLEALNKRYSSALPARKSYATD